MLEAELINELNGIEYSNEEIDDYLNWAEISEDELNKISGDIQTKLARKALRECGDFIESTMEKDEYTEAVIKGTDRDAIVYSAFLGMFMPGAFLLSGDYSFGYIMFITNKRLIVVNSNYFNKALGTRIYTREEMKNIRFKRVLDRSKKGLIKNFFKNIVSTPGGFVSMAFGLGVFSNRFFEAYDFDIGFEGKIIFRVIALIALIISGIEPDLETEAIITMKDGKKYDFLVRNANYKEILRYLKKLSNNIRM